MTIGNRIAIVAPNYYPVTCGIGDHSMRLAAELLRRGRDAVVISREPTAPNPDSPEVPILSVRRRAPLEIASDIAALVEQGDFSDVVVQYTPRMWDACRFGSLAVPFLTAAMRRRKIRVALIAHELFTPWSGRPDLALGAIGLRLQFAAVMASSNPIFATTDTRRALVVAAGGLPPHSTLSVLRVGSNAIPVPARPAAVGPRIGVFSTLAIGKRFDVVVAAFEAIVERYPTAQLDILGDLGPKHGRAFRALADRIARSPAKENIHLVGRAGLAQVAASVAALSVYLFPMDTGANTRSGTLPLPLGSGVPVVAVRGPETDTVFVDRENVLFAASLSGEAFATAALEILSNPALHSRLAGGGKELYRNHLSWERIADQLLSALASTDG